MKNPQPAGYHLYFHARKQFRNQTASCAPRGKTKHLALYLDGVCVSNKYPNCQHMRTALKESHVGMVGLLMLSHQTIIIFHSHWLRSLTPHWRKPKWNDGKILNTKINTDGLLKRSAWSLGRVVAPVQRQNPTLRSNQSFWQTNKLQKICLISVCSGVGKNELVVKCKKVCG